MPYLVQVYTYTFNLYKLNDSLVHKLNFLILFSSWIFDYDIFNISQGWNSDRTYLKDHRYTNDEGSALERFDKLREFALHMRSGCSKISFKSGEKIRSRSFIPTGVPICFSI